MNMDPAEYERFTAIVSLATIARSTEIAFPDLSMKDLDAMIVAIIDRMARLRGWSIRPDRRMNEDDE